MSGCLGLFLAFSCVRPQTAESRTAVPAQRLANSVQPAPLIVSPMTAEAVQQASPDASASDGDEQDQHEYPAPSKEELLRLRFAAQARILGAGREIEDSNGRPLPLEADLANVPDVINGNALGEYLPVENEEALENFYAALRELRTGRLPSGKVRILAYGASHTQSDFYTGYLRYYLQSRFGDGGVGFVLLAPVNEGYRLLDARAQSSGFSIQRARRTPSDLVGDYGLFGAAALSYSPRAIARILPDVAEDTDTGSQLELFYALDPKGGDFTVRLGDEPEVRIRSRGDASRAAYLRLQAKRGWKRLDVRPTGNGSVRLFGATIERDDPGVVVDTLGISGTRAASMLHWNEELWIEHVRRRDPRLVTLAYGTNEATDLGEPISVYEANLRRVLTRIKKAAPRASCLLISPGDFPKKKFGGYIERPRLLEIITIQRNMARELGCGFWDAYSFMGGAGSMQRWVRAKPKMARNDRIHFTVRGYVKLGMALGDALMRRFDAPSDS